ncbi:deoxyribose-phosphate aldolase [Bradymonas sediminis]|uniref:Deoxyribose-phosphate aldolase n=1 Tax=Bradymonas sediminis TaxID=1548548 RepID=A0A2Z4FRD7_9DELT|nr:deoxyribose-phosphate aldolase [Bradymonas sediminis]AWV91285.1 deoxyribose-phosphate aldolase [Bradymonas sediminis]TDP73857.1 deoxyribose-phosphate aldolase [Bradymonas sediminis]
MSNSYQTPRVPAVDQVGVEERAARFNTRSIKKGAKLAGLDMAISMIDLTTLAGDDTPGKVRMLCRKALRPSATLETPQVAAVCVYPSMVKVAVEELAGSKINVASVATYFPSGQTTMRERLEDVKSAVGDGASEIDMVINRGAFLSGEYARVFDEICQVRAACGDAHLKVILETGELHTYDNVRLASQIAIDAGAHFIKTSTGKISPAATMPVTLVMLQTIRDHYLQTGKMVGMKPAGGIRDTKTALRYLIMVKETLGDAWLNPDWFRFGASSLLNDLLMQIEKQHSGHYHSSRYLSIS